MGRSRSHSDPTSPQSTPPNTSSSRLPSATYSTTSTAATSTSPTSLTAESLAKLTLDNTRPSRWTHSQHSHGTIRRPRVPSATPSATSVSDGGEETEDLTASFREEANHWASRGKGKGKESASVVGPTDESGSGSGSGLAGSLPPELLGQIIRLLNDPRDIMSALMVSRLWCSCAFPSLWVKPNLTSPNQLSSFIRTIISPNPTLPYANCVRKLNFAAVTSCLNDDLLSAFENCTRVERLTLSGIDNISSLSLRALFRAMADMVAVDLSGVPAVDDAVLEQIAGSCGKLQGLNLTGCKAVEDHGVRAIAARGKKLRRLKLNGCHRVRDDALVVLARSCPLLLELDLANIPQLDNATIFAIFLNSAHLRELRLNGNINIDHEGFPDLPDLLDWVDEDIEGVIRFFPKHVIDYSDINHPIVYRPVAEHFEHLRVVDLTGCSQINDLAVKYLVASAPRIRNLTLAKCSMLTDVAVEHIGKLGRHLHYLHLGHVSEITDAAVTKLARACRRLRYIDLACCPLLTDLSVFELSANLPKLRRVGLVKVVNLTDEGVYALIDRHQSLERIHLSYCDNISVKAITQLLNRLLRLTHLSLTGVSAFKTPELQKFCRPAPAEFNDHQQAAFCVYSGHGINDLRTHLNALEANRAGSDTSTRRDSASSTSSVTLGASPPFGGVVSGRRISAPTHFGGSGSGSGHGFGPRRMMGSTRSDGEGLGSAFATMTPNFLASQPMPGGYRRGPRERDGSGSGGGGSNRDVRAWEEERRRSTGTGIGTGTGGGAGAGAGGTSPLRWVAGMVGWGGGEGVRGNGEVRDSRG